MWECRYCYAGVPIELASSKTSNDPKVKHFKFFYNLIYQLCHYTLFNFKNKSIMTLDLISRRDIT
jgi:hypothetical protein